MDLFRLNPCYTPGDAALEVGRIVIYSQRCLFNERQDTEAKTVSTGDTEVRREW